MREADMSELLLGSVSHCAARGAEQQVAPGPGFYAIFVDIADSLPPPFSQTLRDQRTELIYIGIATKSLIERLVDQDLRHRNSSSFFRSLGAILGYRPPVGSLSAKKNQSNYKFSSRDTKDIVEWIDLHLSIRWLPVSPAANAAEEAAIRRHRPLLNITHNPTPSRELQDLRQLCRALAMQAPEVIR
jgi:hypothetical protein